MLVHLSRELPTRDENTDRVYEFNSERTITTQGLRSDLGSLGRRRGDIYIRFSPLFSRSLWRNQSVFLGCRGRLHKKR